MMEFIEKADVPDACLEAGVKIETQEMLSTLKMVWKP